MLQGADLGPVTRPQRLFGRRILSLLGGAGPQILLLSRSLDLENGTQCIRETGGDHRKLFAVIAPSSKMRGSSEELLLIQQIWYYIERGLRTSYRKLNNGPKRGTLASVTCSFN